MSSFNRSSSSSSKQCHCVRGSHDKLIENVVETVAASAAETAAPIQPKLYSWFVHRTHIHIVTLYQHIWHLTFDSSTSCNTTSCLPKKSTRKRKQCESERGTCHQTHRTQKKNLHHSVHWNSIAKNAFIRLTQTHSPTPIHTTTCNVQWRAENDVKCCAVLCCAIRRDETLVC